MLRTYIACILSIPAKEIGYERARGGCEANGTPASLRDLFSQRALVLFLVCAFLFHFANAAMLPQLGEKLAHGNRHTAAPFMAACIAVTQLIVMLSAVWIGRLAHAHGRKWLLLIGFGVLPLRAIAYTIVHGSAPLIAIQVLDGVANAIFGVVSLLVIADMTRGSGRFNLASGALATSVGLGAALSNSFGGWLVHNASYNVSFLALGGVALAATVLLAVGMPETRRSEETADAR